MRKSIYALLAAASLGVMATGCNDQLDIPQKGVYPSDTYYSTDDEVASGLALSMSYINNMAFEIIESINCLSDDVWPGGSNSGDQPGLHQFSGFYISTENDKVQNIYSFSYRLIYFSNVLIEAIDRNENPTPYMKQAQAEAYFLRGWAEFYLGTLWGNPPVITKVLTKDEYTKVFQSQEGEMLAQSEADFKKAIELGLPKKAALGDKENLAHCTEGAALGYLGKVQLFEKKYAEAAATLDKLIDSNTYALYTGAYEDIIKSASNWSDEGVFEINCPPNQTDATAPQLMSYVYLYAGWRSDFFEFSNFLVAKDFNFDTQVMYVSPKGDLVAFNTPLDKDANERIAKENLVPYNDMQKIRDIQVYKDFNDTGYGFFNPQGALVDAIIKSDGDGKDGKGRLNSIVKDQDFVQDVLMMAKKPAAPAHGHGLYCGWKNRYLWSDVSLNWGGWSPFPANNFRFMRYAEVLLRAAEAHFMAGNAGKALQYVNMVRKRGNAAEYTSIDLEKIKLECQVELCMEGQRFMDLVRWGDAAKVLGKQGQNIEKLDVDANGKWILVPDDASSPSYGFKAGRNELLPYPQREIDQNPNIKQNPGY